MIGAPIPFRRAILTAEPTLLVDHIVGANLAKAKISIYEVRLHLLMIVDSCLQL